MNSRNILFLHHPTITSIVCMYMIKLSFNIKFPFLAHSWRYLEPPVGFSIVVCSWNRCWWSWGFSRLRDSCPGGWGSLSLFEWNRVHSCQSMGNLSLAWCPCSTWHKFYNLGAGIRSCEDMGLIRFLVGYLAAFRKISQIYEVCFLLYPSTAQIPTGFPPSLKSIQNTDIPKKT